MMTEATSNVLYLGIKGVYDNFKQNKKMAEASASVCLLTAAFLLSQGITVDGEW